MESVKESHGLAERLVDEAGRILAGEGQAALTVRRVAAACGTSTMAVYTLFGDKDGLLGAMFRAGFERLRASSVAAALPHADPLVSLAEVGLAYRRAALANPHLYDLMFGRPVTGFHPDAESELVAGAAYAPLLEGVERALAAGAMKGEPSRIALHLWAVSHGMVSLELAGHLPPGVDPERAYSDALMHAITPFL